MRSVADARAPDGPGVASPWVRLRAALACRRCAVGWALYLAAAAVLVAFFRT